MLASTNHGNSAGIDPEEGYFFDHARWFVTLGVGLYATLGPADLFERNGVKNEVLRWPPDGDGPKAVDYIRWGKANMVIYPSPHV